MIRLIFVRHGETRENCSGICQGQSEGILTSKGKTDNKVLAKKLSSMKIDYFCSSPLNRAVETGEEIIKYHPDQRLKIDKRLTERGMGVLQGHKFPTDYLVSTEYEQMESIDAFMHRLKSFIVEIVEAYQNKTVLIVSHGISIRAMTMILEKRHTNEIYHIEMLANSTFKCIEFEGKL